MDEQEKAEEWVRANIYCQCGHPLAIDIDHLKTPRIYVYPCPECARKKEAA